MIYYSMRCLLDDRKNIVFGRQTIEQLPGYTFYMWRDAEKIIFRMDAVAKLLSEVENEKTFFIKGDVCVNRHSSKYRKYWIQSVAKIMN